MEATISHSSMGILPIEIIKLENLAFAVEGKISSNLPGIFPRNMKRILTLFGGRI